MMWIRIQTWFRDQERRWRRWRRDRKPVGDSDGAHLFRASTPVAFSDHALKILVVDAGLPDPNQDAGSVATCEILRLLHEAGHEVTFLAHQAKGEFNATTESLRDGGVTFGVPEGRRSGLVWFNRRGQGFDALLVFRFALAEPYFKAAREKFSRLGRIFHAADLHHLRLSRQAEITQSMRLAAQAALMKEREIAVIGHAHATIVHSDVEARWIREQVPQAAVLTFPWVARVQSEGPSFEAREGLLFVGSFRHPPNCDAILWFVKNVFPLIRLLLPHVRLHIVGSGMPEEIRALAGPGILAHGFVENLETFYHAARLSISPLRFGAGIKGKVIQALSYGLPAVVSPIAIEGMNFIEGRGVEVCESPDAFACAVVSLYQDAEQWCQQSRAARAVVEEAFSETQGKAHLAEALAQMQLRLEAPARKGYTNGERP